MQVQHDPVRRRTATAALRHYLTWNGADVLDTADCRSAVIDVACRQGQAQDSLEADALLRNRSTGPESWQQQRAQHAPQHRSYQSLPDRLFHRRLPVKQRARR
jgi:hypothetical protein